MVLGIPQGRIHEETSLCEEFEHESNFQYRSDSQEQVGRMQLEDDDGECSVEPENENDTREIPLSYRKMTANKVDSAKSLNEWTLAVVEHPSSSLYGKCILMCVIRVKIDPMTCKFSCYFRYL